MGDTMRFVNTLPWSLSLLVALVFAPGCKKKALPDSATPAPPVEHIGPPLTDEDYLEFGRDLEKAIASGDAAAANKLFRIIDLFQRSLADLDLSDADKQGLIRGATASKATLAGQIVDQFKKGGKYTVLRARTVDSKKQVIMRFISAEGALNYHTFTLVRYPDGQIGAEDVGILVTGEVLTQTFRRLILNFAAERKVGILDRLSKTEQLYTKHITTLKQMATDARQGRHQQALDAFRALPAELQKDKLFQLVAIQAAQGLDEHTYFEELERFRFNHPDDAAIDLLAIDFYLIKKEYDKSIESINRVDQHIGGDPYLNVLRAGTLTEAGRFQEALASAEKAVEDDPKLEAAYWAAITTSLKAKNYPAVLAWVKKGMFAANLAVDPAAIKENRDWAGFVASPQFEELKEWLAR